MEHESRIVPVLCHLAWLAERIDDDMNRGRAYDAALLTYNAAAMLQWRFMAPLSSADTIRDPVLRSEAAELIDGLVIGSRRIVSLAKDARGDESDGYRARLRDEIQRVLKRLPMLLLTPAPQPIHMPVLDASVSVGDLMSEFRDVHEADYAEAYVKQFPAAAKGGGGLQEALDEAIAGLIYAHDRGSMAADDPALRRALAEMSAGFFKTAVDMQSEDDPTAQNSRLQDLAELLYDDAAARGDD